MSDTDQILRHTAILVEIERLTDELLAASRDYRQAKARYTRRRRTFETDPLCDIRVREDRQARIAAAATDWHGRDMVSLGTALAALTAVLDRTAVET